MLSASSPAVQAFARAYEENRNLAVRRSIGAGFSGYQVVLEDRRLYIAVDETDRGDRPPYTHRSGRFLIDRATGTVYTIHGYGKRGDRIGAVAQLTERFRAATATFDPTSHVHMESGRAGVASTPRARPGLTVIRGGLARRRVGAHASRPHAHRHGRR